MIVKKSNIIIWSCITVLLMWCAWNLGVSIGSRSMIAGDLQAQEINERQEKGSKVWVKPLERQETPVISLGRIEVSPEKVRGVE